MSDDDDAVSYGPDAVVAISAAVRRVLRSAGLADEVVPRGRCRGSAGFTLCPDGGKVYLWFAGDHSRAGRADRVEAALARYASALSAAGFLVRRGSDLGANTLLVCRAPALPGSPEGDTP